MADILSLNFFASSFLILTLGVWIKRIAWASKFRKTNPPLKPVHQATPGSPKISVIVPARNEEANIVRCLRHLLVQNYPDYEIIVVNDRSSDRTSALIAETVQGAKISVKEVRIRELPPGWTGKNHAMFIGAKAADSHWLLFTDADTTHKAWSLQTAMAITLERKIDFLTLAPETESRSFWEKTVQPLAVGSLALWFNAVRVNDPDSPFTLANGQYILIRREAYEKIGGSESVKDEVIEDVELAKKMKSAGFCVRFLNGTALYSTRMYSSLRAIKTGWTRIFTYLFDKKITPILGKIFSFVFFSMLPLAILGSEVLFFFTAPRWLNFAVLGLSGTVCLVIFIMRFVGNRLLRTNPWFAFLHPLGVLVMLWILLACLARILWKRPSVWRGDLYH
jgi:chlorobactene glucosyltransferase